MTRESYIARLKEVWGEAWERHDEWPDLPAGGGEVSEDRPEYEAYVFDAADDEVAGCSGPDLGSVAREIMHYASQYAEDGQVRVVIEEVRRRDVSEAEVRAAIATIKEPSHEA